MKVQARVKGRTHTSSPWLRMSTLTEQITGNFKGHLKTGTVEKRLFEQLELERIPRHVAIIMDGNGRWAQKRRLPRVAGHRAGIVSVRETVETAARLKVQVLTLYAFSVENWKRPAGEVSTLMSLLKEFLRKELRTLMKNNIRFATLGRISELDPEIQKELELAKSRTARNDGMVFNVALNYGGRAELVDAFKRLIEKTPNGKGHPVEITEESIAACLYTAGLPDPDLMIRTSGELRVSNFLLWQIAYAEIWVTETLWPDFRKKDFFEGIIAYQKRERRYGGLATK
jgi:undecaprenyl diphosphate synthase